MNLKTFIFIDDLNKFAGQRVMICGGGDSAVDWALMLEPIAEKVTLVHRRDKFRAHEHSVEKLINSKVDIKTPYIPEELIGEEDIKQVVLQHVKNEEKNSIVVNTKQETNIEGIYISRGCLHIRRKS
jgi:thioredoxin reductase (NADPH)